MTKFSHASTKRSKDSRTNLALAFEGSFTFIQEIRVGGRHGSDSEISWKVKHLCSNEFMKP
jgi:hypothetical protein